MDPKRESPKPNEYYVIALQIFDSFETDRNGSLRANKLMEQFAPHFKKTNKSEYALLKSLLDPEQSNPEINVTMLADALNKYSETQKIKPDLEESFNLKGEDLPHDSDSGISSDGFQHLEELQCGLREKSRIVSDLRSQLEHTEETVATLTAEKDSLRAHLKMLREENQSLSQARREYEDTSEQLVAAEAALSEARRHLEDSRRRATTLADKLAGLESDKVILQELLSKSKDECHRINEMYSSRQSGLIELNESLRAQCADLADRLLRQEDYMQALTKEKSSLEMELKDMLNKPNQLLPRLDRSIEVSYTEDQMLTALDSLNSESRFVNEVSSVSTQAEVPCEECEKRVPVVPIKSPWRRSIWDGVKSLFSVFAGLCFLGALFFLYQVSHYHYAARRCLSEGPIVPWRWFSVHDILDFLFRIEYVGEVPM